MADDRSSGLDGLRARLDELVADAREAGLEAELAPLLRGALDGLRRAERSDAEPSDVPSRFGMIGASAAMERLFAELERVADTDVPVLVTGETGTGKELVARALHEGSRRSGARFLAENCAAVSPNLLESELFGHVKGAFTGAVADREGHFAAADGGTVFLDEIGDMPLPMQAKLLRVLQEGEVRPVGSNRVRKVDVRVVAATNRDLEAMCAAGEFRQDLFWRLAVVRLRLPPLREREGDVRHLVRAFLRRFAEEAGVPEPAIDEAALAHLETLPWPGNVRELENEIRRAVALGGDPIRLEDLSTGAAP